MHKVTADPRATSPWHRVERDSVRLDQVFVGSPWESTGHVSLMLSDVGKIDGLDAIPTCIRELYILQSGALPPLCSPTLEKLSVGGHDELTELDVRGCPSLQSLAIQAPRLRAVRGSTKELTLTGRMPEVLPEMKELSLKRCSEVDLAVVQALPLESLELEKLPHRVIELAMPQLRKLRIWGLRNLERLVLDVPALTDLRVSAIPLATLGSLVLPSAERVDLTDCTELIDANGLDAPKATEIQLSNTKITKTRIDARYHTVCLPQSKFKKSKRSATKAPKKRAGKAGTQVEKITQLIRANDYETVDQGIALAEGLASPDVLHGLLEHLDVQAIKTTTAGKGVIYKSHLKPWGLPAEFHTLKANTVFQTTAATRAVREYAARRLVALVPDRHFDSVQDLCLRADDKPVSLAGLAAFPKLRRLLICNPAGFRDLDRLAETQVEVLYVSGGSGVLELPVCALRHVLLASDQIRLGTGCGRVTSWTFGVDPVPDLKDLNGVQTLAIDVEGTPDPKLFSELARISTLEDLTLFGGHGTIEPYMFKAVARLPKLRALDLATTRYLPEDLSVLSDHPTLERLYFGRAKKTELPKALRSIARKKR